VLDAIARRGRMRRVEHRAGEGSGEDVQSAAAFHWRGTPATDLIVAVTC